MANLLTLQVLSIPVLSISFSQDARDCMSTFLLLKGYLTRTNCNIGMNYSLFDGSLLLVAVHIIRGFQLSCMASIKNYASTRLKGCIL
jgi:hypothetical protein